MAWYRTYRPQTISGLHVPEIRKVFERIRDTGVFNHAYLFTGPKGIGKTTSARILAKLLNCQKNAQAVEAFLKGVSKTASSSEKQKLKEPCGECSTCKGITSGTSLTVTEMDAASNRGIDDIRALRDRINIVPPDGKVSIFIIDEVHMLTTEAFNALLKVLEEPPKHVVFVLATTELHKVPDTVVSRCQVVMYTKALSENLVKALTDIAKAEHIEVDQKTLEQIAEKADGSFRDAVKLFEQLALGKSKLALEDIQQTLAMSYHEYAKHLIQSLLQKNEKAVVDQFSQMLDQDADLGYLQKTVLLELHAMFKDAIEKQASGDVKQLLKLLQLLNVPSQSYLPEPYLPFELACIEACLEDDKPQESLPQKVTVDKPKLLDSKPEEKQGHPDSQKTELDHAAEQIPQTPMEIPERGAEDVFTILEEQWKSILLEVKPANASLEALLRAVRPLKVERNKVLLEVFYSFHKEQLETARYKKIIEETVEKICNIPKAQVSYVLGKRTAQDIAEKTKKDAELVQATEEAFL